MKKLTTLLSAAGFTLAVVSPALASSTDVVKDVTPDHWQTVSSEAACGGEAKCGEGKCGEGKADEKKDEGKKEDEKKDEKKEGDASGEKKEGKGGEAGCGEGKCG